MFLISTNGKIGLKNGKIAIKGPAGTDCCCDDFDCTGCHKWVSDLSGLSVATVEISGDCGTESKSDLLLEGDINCGRPVLIHYGPSTIFENPEIRLTWNTSTGKFDWFIKAAFLDAECNLDFPNGEVTAYACSPCEFSMSIEIPVIDLGDCHCSGVVVFTITLDLSDGPDCEE